jgi:membrane-bound lytic murein transglycosylase MltF
MRVFFDTTRDMMEMLNVGLLEAIVVDDWKAKMWVQLLPNLRV